MPKKTINSNRIYKETQAEAAAIEKVIKTTCQAKIAAYAVLAYNKPLPKDTSLHMMIKDQFNLNTYYANFAVREAQAAYASNKELQNLYIKEKEERISHLADKIKKTKDKIAFHEKVLKDVIAMTKAKSSGENIIKTKRYIHLTIEFKDKTLWMVTKHGEKQLLYLYEHQKLRPLIKRLRNRLNFLKRKETYELFKLKKLKDQAPRSCFGSKKLMKSRNTIYKEDPVTWKKLFHQQRFKTFCVQGVKTSKDGNFCAKLTPSNEFVLTDPQDTKKTYRLTGVVFRYKKNDHKAFYDLIHKGFEAVAYRIEDYGDYFIIKASYEVKPVTCNHATVDGVVAIDLNYDHIALANLSRDGNLLSRKVIPFDLEHKTTGQAKKIIEKAINQVVQIAENLHKPIAHEQLKNPSKSSLKYGNKKRNAKLSAFAHNKMLSALESRAHKQGVGRLPVDPAYTSQFGKIKYMKQKGLSIHEAAAYTIGRRALGFNEKVPKCYKHLGTDLKKLCFSLKSIPTYKFYQKIDPASFSDIKAYKKALSA